MSRSSASVGVDWADNGTYDPVTDLGWTAGFGASATTGREIVSIRAGAGNVGLPNDDGLYSLRTSAAFTPAQILAPHAVRITINRENGTSRIAWQGYGQLEQDDRSSEGSQAATLNLRSALATAENAPPIEQVSRTIEQAFRTAASGMGLTVAAYNGATITPSRLSLDARPQRLLSLLGAMAKGYAYETNTGTVGVASAEYLRAQAPRTIDQSLVIESANATPLLPIVVNEVRVGILGESSRIGAQGILYQADVSQGAHDVVMPPGQYERIEWAGPPTAFPTGSTPISVGVGVSDVSDAPDGLSFSYRVTPVSANTGTFKVQRVGTPTYLARARSVDVARSHESQAQYRPRVLDLSEYLEFVNVGEYANEVYRLGEPPYAISLRLPLWQDTDAYTALVDSIGPADVFAVRLPDAGINVDKAAVLGTRIVWPAADLPTIEVDLLELIAPPSGPTVWILGESRLGTNTTL